MKTLKRKSNLFKQPVRKILLVYRKDTSEARAMATELAAWLQEQDIKVLSHPGQRIKINSRPLPSLAQSKGSRRQTVDLAIVLGGDGTYLEALRVLNGHKVPMLGINMGSLGFLTFSRVEDLYPVVEMALNGKMELRRRSMLKIQLKRKRKPSTQYVALNDMVIERGPLSQLIHVAVSIDQLLINSIKADGLILATPTGSTAYNLAAGGPILHPEVSAFAVTPICPHSLTHRPLILPDDRKIRFHLEEPDQKAVLTLDGQNCGEISFGDEVTVMRNDCDHFILRQPSHNYFNLLREKLRFGERA